jgi:hypothetical protein
VWGEPDQGYVKNFVVYRRGIVTTSHKVIKTTPGTPLGYEILSCIENQEIEFFASNVAPCADPFVDNFYLHVDCSVRENVNDIQMTCGPRFCTPEDTQVEWPDLVLNTEGNVVVVQAAGIQMFQWVNVWLNDDALVSVCPVGSSNS